MEGNSQNWCVQSYSELLGVYVTWSPCCQMCENTFWSRRPAILKNHWTFMNILVHWLTGVYFYLKNLYLYIIKKWKVNLQANQSVGWNWIWFIERYFRVFNIKIVLFCQLSWMSPAFCTIEPFKSSSWSWTEIFIALIKPAHLQPVAMTTLLLNYLSSDKLCKIPLR